VAKRFHLPMMDRGSCCAKVYNNRSGGVDEEMNERRCAVTSSS